jgi:putative heme iron utilization protein
MIADNFAHIGASASSPLVTERFVVSAERDFDAIRCARRLLFEARSAALATLLPDGSPNASLVSVATLPDGAPLLLLSNLARHTTNIARDPRVSLLIAEQRAGEPLGAARVTLVGTIATTVDPAARRRFLARHPDAAAYADFKDFSFWRIEPARAHVVAGFGRIADVGARDLVNDLRGAEAVLAVEQSAIEHMNADHADAVELYATRLLGDRAGPWRIIGIDPAGCDLMLDGTVRRLEFSQCVTSPDALRNGLAELARNARA